MSSTSYYKVDCVSWPYGQPDKHVSELFRMSKENNPTVNHILSAREIMLWREKHRHEAWIYHVYDSDTARWSSFDRFRTAIPDNDLFFWLPEAFEIKGTLGVFIPDARHPEGVRRVALRTTLAGSVSMIEKLILDKGWRDNMHFEIDFDTWRSDRHNESLTWRKCLCPTCKSLRGES